MSRKRKIEDSIIERGLYWDTAQRPYRNIITSTESKKKYYGVLSDSLAFGVFIKQAVDVSCPGATLESLASKNIANDFKERGVEGITLLGGTNSLVKKDGQIEDVETVVKGLEHLIDVYKEAGMDVVVLQVPGRKDKGEIMKEIIPKLRDRYKEVCEAKGVKFHKLQRFKMGHLDADNLHPRPDKVNELMKDIYNALEKVADVSISGPSQ